MTDLRKIAEDAIRLGAGATKRPWLFRHKSDTFHLSSDTHSYGKEIIRFGDDGHYASADIDFIVHAANNIEALARDWLLLDEVAKAAEHLGIERNHILGEWNPICYQYGIVRLVEALEALRKHRTPTPEAKVAPDA